MHPYLGTFIYPVVSYNLFLALAFLGGIMLALYLGPKLGISRGRVLDMAVWFVISALLGARLLYVALFPERFSTVWDWFDFQRGGLVFFGGFFATLAVMLLYCRHHGIDPRDAADMIAPSLGLGHGVGRIGCFLSGCCHGGVTDLPWGIVIPRLGDQQPRHPTQLYESAFLIILCLWGCWKIRERAKDPAGDSSPPGRIWGWYVLLYSSFRFLVEFLRDDERGGFFTPWHLSPSQLIALGGIAFALGWFRFCSRSVSSRSGE